MKITFQLPSGNTTQVCDVPGHIPLSQLWHALMRKLCIPLMDGWGRTIRYDLLHGRTGNQIPFSRSLRDVTVYEGETLIILPTLVAAAISTPRLRRLESDYRRLKALEEQSNLVQITSVEGMPPHKYVITLTVKGIESMYGNHPTYRSNHQVVITLGANYPTDKPSLQCLTPVFHPNFSSGGTVCIGAWAAGKWLDELVIMVAEMIQYKTPPTKDTLNDVYNEDAVRWIRNNRSLLPVDNRQIRKSGSIDDLIRVLPVDNDDMSDNFEIKIL